MIGFVKASIRGLARRTFLAATSFFGSTGRHYDAAETTDENRKHWGRARDNTPRTANTPGTRKTMRVRCRYEADNNCYLSGLVSTLATDVIGYIAPKLQLLSDDSELNTFVESEWIRWTESEQVNWSSKLRVLDETRRIEGEGFLALIMDEECEQATGYSLNVTVISPARVCDPDSQYVSANQTRDVVINGVKTGTRNVINDDGVIVDALTGRAVEFKVIPSIDDWVYTKPATVSARYMLQWFCPRRAGQFRGVCELAPALPLYAQLRRYGLATLSAAEIAAMFAGIMTTQVPPGEDPPQLEPGFKLELERGMLVAMPEGSQAQQFKPEQPISSYEMFVNLILREIGRTLDVPFGIVAGDSSKYNYSSAQLDYRGYEERMNFDKKQLIIRIQNPVFREFILELSTKNTPMGRKVRQYLEADKLYHTWHFSRRPSSDPEKDANAEDTRLRNGTITYAEIYASRGMDYEEQWDQREKENAILEKKKLAFDGISGTIGSANASQVVDTNTSNNTTSTENSSQKEAAKTADVQQSSLNGAQIASMLLVADKIVSGEYSVDAGVALLQISFPLVDVSQLRGLVEALSKSKGAEPKPPVPQNPVPDTTVAA